MNWRFWRKQDGKAKSLQSVDDTGGGWVRIFDWVPRAWQQHRSYTGSDSPLAFPSVFACITLISSDIAKLRPMIQKQRGNIWKEESASQSKLLKKPNHYQNHIQFKEWWINSKLIHGNTYVLKERDAGKIIGLYLLDPTRVTPLVSDSGEVFYRLNEDNLSGLREGQVVVPSSEIIHDRFNCLFHPLVGLSPIYANTTAANIGLTIEKNARHFFKNGSNPGGVLTAPGNIADETAKRLKDYWEENFTGEKSGKVAALGDGLKYEPMRMNNTDAQMLEHLKWSAETVCSTYHVPAYKIGVGNLPTYNNIEALTQDYYSQCLQFHIESMEETLADGVELDDGYRVQVDLDGLFRMDTATKIKTLVEGLKGIYSPDEAREKINLEPVPGGKFPYLQQQNYSLQALAVRDAKNPLAAPEPQSPLPDEDEDISEDELAEMAYKNLLLLLEPAYKSQIKVFH